MDPNIWGPHAWHFMHAVTLSYPLNPTQKQKNTYKLFFHNLTDILPCTHCSSNYKIHITQLPIEPFLKNRKTLVSWLIQIHNLTNKHLKKNTFFTLPKFIQHYNQLYSKQPSNTTISLHFLFTILLSLLCLLIIYYIFYNQIKQYFYIYKNYIFGLQTLH